MAMKQKTLLVALIMSAWFWGGWAMAQHVDLYGYQTGQATYFPDAEKGKDVISELRKGEINIVFKWKDEHTRVVVEKSPKGETVWLEYDDRKRNQTGWPLSLGDAGTHLVDVVESDGARYFLMLNYGGYTYFALVENYRVHMPIPKEKFFSGLNQYELGDWKPLFLVNFTFPVQIRKTFKSMELTKTGEIKVSLTDGGAEIYKAKDDSLYRNDEKYMRLYWRHNFMTHKYFIDVIDKFVREGDESAFTDLLNEQGQPVAFFAKALQQLDDKAEAAKLLKRVQMARKNAAERGRK